MRPKVPTLTLLNGSLESASPISLLVTGVWLKMTRTRRCHRVEADDAREAQYMRGLSAQVSKLHVVALECDALHSPRDVETMDSTHNTLPLFFQTLQRRVLVAALWDKKVIIQDPLEEEILGFYGRNATQGEKKTSSEAVLRLNSASEKESVLLKEDQTDL
ncbi:hypothetical protein TNCV_3732941 [Trichonephila clavipes]|nr:hypothetical protein TNCV_3732941 [Trichonephila clavipes]